MLPRPILIAAGGTGGHIFPALAVAQRLRELGASLMWLGTRQGLEAKLVPKAGYPLLTVSIAGVRSKGWSTRLLAPFRLLWALGQSLWLMLRHRPRAVLGMGGFVSGPAGVAAWLLRVPLLIHEQNAIAGLTNTLLARIADRVMEAFPGTFRHRGAIGIGNPVRADILAIPAPDARLAVPHPALRILVIGGSQGALILNQMVPAALARLSGCVVEVWHQCGQKHLDATRAGYDALKIEARVEPFIDGMSGAYAWADLVICRSGALTVAELAAAGVGSILIPFPGAVDDHQTANARYLANAGAALLIPQPDFTAERLATELGQLLGAPERLREMAIAARRLAWTDATERVAAQCLEVADG
jgi:UDP-N-acetylglucosamine--N-acetylmuramyl-(pentapeptide) pyrophosphoryl-undecaprenol N-acetylglucosamine transferase